MLGWNGRYAGFFFPSGVLCCLNDENESQTSVLSGWCCLLTSG
jgi:hypothetical protein